MACCDVMRVTAGLRLVGADQVDPGVSAAVETSQEHDDRHGCACKQRSYNKSTFMYMYIHVYVRVHFCGHITLRSCHIHTIP